MQISGFPDTRFYNDLSTEKPRLLVSACLMGESVRYDGQHKHFPVLETFFREHALLTTVCPEMGAGLGVPRPAVALHATATGIQALGVDDNTLNVTRGLSDFSQHFAGEFPLDPARTPSTGFHAIILKSRSPSCGVGSTPVIQANQTTLSGNGIFADTLLEQWHSSVIVEETGLITEEQCAALLYRCYVLMDIQLTPLAKIPLLLAHYAEHFNRVLVLDDLQRWVLRGSFELT